ncbi:hypothetical protein HAX54_004273 [Datura stramonium]|uniref:Uncharacterized protein n=1 Tax=Datura stramonium TaxID=4076 RepID=A0ABS8T6Q2_DATST|nr:hypothetical protein [Datura stramonium]
MATIDYSPRFVDKSLAETSLPSILLTIDGSSAVRRPPLVVHRNSAGEMSSSRDRSNGKTISTSKTKGKAKSKASSAPANTREVIVFCVPNMKGHYAICEGFSITMEKHFDLAGMRGDFPNITR